MTINRRILPLLLALLMLVSMSALAETAPNKRQLLVASHLFEPYIAPFEAENPDVEVILVNWGERSYEALVNNLVTNAKGFDKLEFDAFVNGKKLPPSNRVSYFTDEETGEYYYLSEYHTEDMKALPDEIRFVPLRVQLDPSQPYRNNVLRAQPDEANAFTLRVK